MVGNEYIKRGQWTNEVAFDRQNVEKGSGFYFIIPL